MNSIYQNDVVRELIDSIGKVFNVSPELIMSKKRIREAVDSRHFLILIFRNYWGWGWMDIERELGINHSTAIIACRQCIDLYRYDKIYRRKVEQIIENL